MNRQTERMVKSDMCNQLKKNKSLNRVSSRSWYAEDLTRCLHTSLRHYADVKDVCDNDHDAKVYGVYLRYEMGQSKRVKIGKGVIYFYNGRSICTRDHLSATENPLETEVFIPCVDEASALTLEDALHRHFGKLEGVHLSIVAAYDIAYARWLKPTVNSEGNSGGTENFDFEDIWDQRVDYFTDAVEKVCQQRNVNVENFAKKARENSQVKGSDLIADWLLNGNDLPDFFLLMKPRSGKNTTMFFGIAKYVSALKKRNAFDKKLIIDFLSLWPSAFEGAKKDIKQYFYMEDVVIAGIDTSEPGWRDRIDELLADDSVDVVFRFASMQSIDMKIAEAYNNDENREGADIAYESDKCDYFKKNPADLCVNDECDHGMRTPRSIEVLQLFGYTRRIWMSGTDLYALRQENIRPGNHFLYDIFNEIEDVKSGNIVMPRMRKHSLVANELPLNDLDPDIMDEKEITRKLTNVLATNMQGDKSKWKYNATLDRFVDRNAKVVKFEHFGELQRLWDMIYYWENINGHKAPNDHQHIFCCMPTVASCLAIYNHIKEGTLKCKHEPLTANTFASANRIEQQVNDRMGVTNANPQGTGQTIFLTVGRMLRGAKAPWSAVVRFDAYSDFKVGHQLELRGQNTNEDWFDVYDANMFRSSVMQYDLIRSRTKNGAKIDSVGKKLHSLIPMYRKGEFETRMVTWDDVQSDYISGNVIEGMKRRNLIDSVGVVNAQDMLTGVNGAKTELSTEKDKREGKEGSRPFNPGTPKTPNKETDALEQLIKKGMTVASMVPLLMEITDYQYTDIEELIDNTPDDVFNAWLIEKCGVEKIA